MNLQTKEEIIATYPNRWVLIGNPELDDPYTLAPIIDKLVKGVVLLSSDNRKEIGEKAKEARKGYDSVTCIYTGSIPKNRKWLL